MQNFKKMSELINFSNEYFVLSLYSLIIGLLLYFIAHVSSYFKPFITVWRDYWLVLIILCALPLVFSVIPYSNPDFSVFDVAQLQFTVSDSQYIRPVLYNPYHLTTDSHLSLSNISSLLWLSLYLLGLLYTLSRLVIQIKLIHSIISHSEKIGEKKETLSRANYDLLNRLQKHNNINIVLSPLAISPFVYQWRKKYLVMSQSLFKGKNFSQQQIDLIIEHELIHVKNNDQLLVMISHFVACALWFNPFVKFFQKNMNWAIEAHCDSEVLIQKPHLRKIYAQTMLKILRQSATTTSNHMVAAFSIKTHGSLTMRITNIMKPLHPEVKLKPKMKKLWAAAISAGLLMFITQPQSFASPDATKQALINPVKQAKVSSAYGAKNEFHTFHKGIDLSASIDTPIVSSGDGVVRVSTDLLENRKNYGTLIIIDHVDGFHSVYAHLNSRNVSAGDRVVAGQIIGYVGETGKATGPHLHLELLKDNKHVNPSDYIKF